MGVHHNLITPKNGEPLVAATQDFLTAAYLLTQKNVFLDREHFCMIAAYIGDADEHIDVPKPAIVKPVTLWTGKQLAGLMIRPNKDGPLVNLECQEKNYCAADGGKYFCAKDGYVCFQNSELISGNLAKKTLGDGSKQGLIYTLIRDHGDAQAARVLNRLAKLCARWLGGHKGFSIGIDDVTPSPALQKHKANLIKIAQKGTTDLISSFEKGDLDRERGCTPEESLEHKLNKTLGDIRNNAGEFAMASLAFHNAPRAMAECGSKGSALNVSQMIACVGQQNVSGERIQYGFPSNRTLPHFEKKSLHAPARGFVANSFHSGLTATEFFFHTMGGREGLVDTAVKTAETGYMARRLMKALEDLSAQYDSSVRNSEGNVVQFVYGDDGLNPSVMENGDRPVDFKRLLLDIKHQHPDVNGTPLMPRQLQRMGLAVVKSEAFRSIGSQLFGAQEEEVVKTFGLDGEDPKNDEATKNLKLHDNVDAVAYVFEVGIDTSKGAKATACIFPKGNALGSSPDEFNFAANAEDTPGTLTAGAPGASTIPAYDKAKPVSLTEVGQRVLVRLVNPSIQEKEDQDVEHKVQGVYTVTVLGEGDVATVLTRATDVGGEYNEKTGGDGLSGLTNVSVVDRNTATRYVQTSVATSTMTLDVNYGDAGEETVKKAYKSS
jgi:hypothetical protein